MQTERNYGIDLLRILLTLFICTSHILGRGGISIASENTNAYYIVLFCEAVSVCAVDGYGLISGYIYNGNKNNYKRLVLLVMEAFFYSFIVTVILRMFNLGDPISNIDMLKNAFPVTTNYFWYITAYFPLFFLMPYISDAINRLNDDDTKKLFVLLVLLFSFLGSVQDNYSSYGISFVWLTILFSIGVIIRKINFLESTSKKKLVILFFVFVIFTWIINCIFNTEKITRNISPTVLFSAIILVILFSRFNIKSKLIKFISPLCLGVYLFHMNKIIKVLFMNNRFAFIADANLFLIPFLIMLSASCVFIICAFVDYIRTLLFKLIHAEQIAEFINKIINRILDYISNKLLNR